MQRQSPAPTSVLDITGFAEFKNGYFAEPVRIEGKYYEVVTSAKSKAAGTGRFDSGLHIQTMKVGDDTTNGERIEMIREMLQLVKRKLHHHLRVQARAALELQGCDDHKQRTEDIRRAMEGMREPKALDEMPRHREVAAAMERYSEQCLDGHVEL